MQEIKKPAAAKQTSSMDTQSDSTTPNTSIASLIKSSLVTLGFNEILPLQVVTFLINWLDLREV